MPGTSARLPDFPWDTIAGYRATASAVPGGIVDLSIGTPVDPTPEVVQRALADAADAPGYPTVWGTAELRAAIGAYLSRRFDALPLPEEGLLPVIGTKELVAGMPQQLGLGTDDLVVFPRLAYPTYEVGALMAHARTQAADSPSEVEGTPSLVWVNSPSNPTGRVRSDDELRAWVEYARSVGAVLASDECYAEFGWDAEPSSVLRPDICGGSAEGVLALHSMSKRSNMAGYRAGFVAGDPRLILELLAVRKHLGMMVPQPVQAALIAAMGDRDHVACQRERYLERRAVLKPALESAGFTIDDSEGSLYLWSTRGEDCFDTMAFLAERGILAAPGVFYGEAGRQHVRIALTGTDERIAAASDRLR